MNLLIDIGNTSTKVAVYDRYEKIFFSVLKEINIEVIKEIVINYPVITASIISSVANIPKGIESYLFECYDNSFILDENTPVPFKIEYKTPSTLGRDRIALVAGGISLFPGYDVFIVDLGTAITYDFIDKNGIYPGGNISPGINTRFKALNYYTGKLPLVQIKDEYPFLGNNTENAIVSGVLTGIIYEIDGYIDQLKTKYNDLKVVLTGGDGNFFAGRLKNTIFAEDDLLFLGLNKILTHNILKNSNE